MTPGAHALPCKEGNEKKLRLYGAAKFRSTTRTNIFSPVCEVTKRGVKLAQRLLGCVCSITEKQNC